MHVKVSELASRYRFSVDAIYAWLRSGLIPDACILRAGNSIRIDSDQFDRLLRDGKLYRPRRRKAEERAVHFREAASALGLSEDQHTTRWEKGLCQHRFIADAAQYKKIIRTRSRSRPSKRRRTSMKTIQQTPPSSAAAGSSPAPRRLLWIFNIGSYPDWTIISSANSALEWWPHISSTFRIHGQTRIKCRPPERRGRCV
jgi:hypothetical protein